MKITVFLILHIIVSIPLIGQTDSDKVAIEKAIGNWYAGWQAKDVELAIQDYSDDIDWTNAFGDRIENKSDLESLLTEIFNMDFVMTGDAKLQYNDISFLTANIAAVRSHSLVEGQKWSDGSLMKDRNNHHLRIFEKRNDKWECTYHIVSQAWEKK